ncbi:MULTISPECIES: hypothetical protein [Tenacibaculum]|uniref:hypothetical protein n=1 Tax=Tenacibaculum TaxID=104267 RepID=UPI0008991F4E|nr:MULTISPECIES: hypothetical protein [unclassified Tenacibaculum]RBW58316.1 hypothetical protein DS884_10690 [Tenacibaculum sp. E3R01]SED51248.1 hypothetical protein SAMN04487765_0217 [Tenacibaculum sp. MAR_2010_89]
MKKKFFLPKGLDKFSNLEIKSLDKFKGGAIGPVTDDIIYIPTGGGGRRCPDGMVWSETLSKCVTRIAVEEKKEVRFSM